MEDRCVPSTWTVYSTYDDLSQNYTLPKTISLAESGDTVQFAPYSNYIRLNSAYGPLILDKNLTIKGTSARPVEISGANAERVLAVGIGVKVTTGPVLSAMPFIGPRIAVSSRFWGGDRTFVTTGAIGRGTENTSSWPNRP
jgi:hypothetical protein